MSGSVEKSYVKALYPRYATAVKARFDTAVGSDHAGVRTPRTFLVEPLHGLGRQTHRDRVAAVVRTRRDPPVRHRQVRRHAARGHKTPGDADLPRQHAEHRSAFALGARSAAAIGRGRGVSAPDRTQRKSRERDPRIAHRRRTGGYEQADVTRFANIITGWQVLTPRQLGRFAARWAGIGTDLFYFNADAHEPGDQR